MICLCLYELLGGEGNSTNAFCRQTIDHVTRLSIPSRIKAVIPSEMQHMVPVDSTPICSLYPNTMHETMEGNENLKSISMKLKDMVEKREDADEVEEWLEGLPDLQGEEAEGFSKEVRLYIIYMYA